MGWCFFSSTKFAYHFEKARKNFSGLMMRITLTIKQTDLFNKIEVGMRRRYKNNSNRKLSDQRRKELAQKRSDNINKLNEQESLLDKYLLAITSFMFNAILFFVNSIVKLETAIYIGWFYFAIICSVCSILTIIISIVRSNYIWL